MSAARADFDGHTAGRFAAEYETLLETYSPGYSRNYRAIDVTAELREGFPTVHERHVRELCLLHQRDGSVVLPYLTEGYFGVTRATNP